MASKQPTWQLHEAKARFSELFRRARQRAKPRRAPHRARGSTPESIRRETARLRRRGGRTVGATRGARQAPTADATYGRCTARRDGAAPQLDVCYQEHSRHQAGRCTGVRSMAQSIESKTSFRRSAVTIWLRGEKTRGKQI